MIQHYRLSSHYDEPQGSELGEGASAFNIDAAIQRRYILRGYVAYPNSETPTLIKRQGFPFCVLVQEAQHAAIV